MDLSKSSQNSQDFKQSSENKIYEIDIENSDNEDTFVSDTEEQLNNYNQKEFKQKNTSKVIYDEEQPREDELEIDNLNDAFDRTENIANKIIDMIQSNIMNDIIHTDDEKKFEEEMNENIQSESLKREKKIPKSILLGQQKYLEQKEREMKMKDGKKAKNQKTHKKDVVESKTSLNSANSTMKRVFIGGKLKYIPVLQQDHTDSEKKDINEQKDKNEILNKINSNNLLNQMLVKEEKEEEEEKGLQQKSSNKPMLKKQLEAHTINKDNSQQKMLREAGVRFNDKHSLDSKSTRVPVKYAKTIEDEIKKKTIKNVKTFSDLKKIHEMQNLDINGDPSKISIVELRKLNLEKKRKEFEENKQKMENKKESAVQSILNDEKMSKFSKMVKIKNLANNNRRNLSLNNATMN
jgi:hypothetical protein